MRKNKNLIKFRGELKMRKVSLVILLAFCMVFAVASAAFAVHAAVNGELPPVGEPWDESNPKGGGPYSVSTTGKAGDVISENILGASGSFYSIQLGVAGNQASPKYATHNGVSLDCTYCHAGATNHTSGPHGGYTQNTNKCSTCHGIHAGTEGGSNRAWNSLLLPGENTVQVCGFCHDLTQSELAPYYTSYLQSGDAVKSAHRIKGLALGSGNGTGATPDEWLTQEVSWDELEIVDRAVYNWKTELTGDYNSIPGGDFYTGGERKIVTSGQGKLSDDAFTCDSCHTPHAVAGTMVEPYVGESHRTTNPQHGTSLTVTYTDGSTDTIPADESMRFWVTNKLLKASLQDPNKSRTVADMVYKNYSSDWCAGCHQGRYYSDPATGENKMHNHPVTMEAKFKGTANEGKGLADNYQFLNLLPVNDYAPPYRSTTPELSKRKLLDKVNSDFAAATVPNGNGKQGAYSLLKKSAAAHLDPGKTPLKVGSNLILLYDDPRSNAQYAMVEKDMIHGVNFEEKSSFTAAAAVGGPSCGQCHGTNRDVEKSFEWNEHNNPYTQTTTFPHVGTNPYLLVENGDDLCSNCHGLENLP